MRTGNRHRDRQYPDPKQNILQQAASSILAQANQRPQSALGRCWVAKTVQVNLE